MPRTKTIDENVEELEVTENTPAPYHTMIRFLGRYDIPNRDIWSNETVKAHIAEWVNMGYEIQESHPLQTTRDEESGQLGVGIYFLFKYVG